MFRDTEVKFVFAWVWSLDLGNGVTSETRREIQHTRYYKVALTDLLNDQMTQSVSLSAALTD